MTRFSRKIAGLFVMLFVGVYCMAQEASFTVSAPSVVEVGEPFRVTFSANGDVKNFTPPSMEGFKILAGPQTSTMSSVQIINGKRTSSKTVNYIYIVEASKKGKFTIGPAQADVEGKQCKTTEVTIEVVEGSTAATGSNAVDENHSNEATSTQKQSASVGNEDVMLRLTFSKTHVYKGEPIVATLKLYTRVDITNFEDVRFPSFNGFWSQETYTPTNIQFERENIGGTIYNAAVLRRYLLLPQQVGEIVVDPAELVCVVRTRTSGGHSFIDDFFDSYQTVRKKLSTKEIKIKVNNLPSGAPASFNGAVGKFSIKASVSKDSIRTHEAVSYNIKISGEGNLNLLETPKVNFPPDFETYDAKVTDNSRSTGVTYSGNKVFEYPIIPRSNGDFTINSVEFSFFNLETGKYETIKTNAVPLHVERSEQDTQGGAMQFTPGVSKRGVQNLGEDVRYIVTTAPKWRVCGSFFIGSVGFWIALVLLIALFFAISAMIKRSRRRRADVSGVRSRKANKVAKNRLKNAEILLNKQLFTAFYEELHRALWGYVSDKLALAQADCNKDNIKEILSSQGVGEEMSNEFLELIEACEYARYAPVEQKEENTKIYERAVKCISGFEQHL